MYLPEDIKRYIYKLYFRNHVLGELLDTMNSIEFIIYFYNERKQLVYFKKPIQYTDSNYPMYTSVFDNVYNKFYDTVYLHGTYMESAVLSTKQRLLKFPNVV